MKLILRIKWGYDGEAVGFYAGGPTRRGMSMNNINKMYQSRDKIISCSKRIIDNDKRRNSVACNVAQTELVLIMTRLNHKFFSDYNNFLRIYMNYYCFSSTESEVAWSW